METIEVGSAEIRFQSHKQVDVFGKRVTFKAPKTFPVLRIHGQIAMSVSPQEALMMKRDAAKAARGGRFLVAGLGLGVILEHLRKKKAMIHVVEKNKDVIAAYRKYKKNAVDYDFLHETTIEDYLEKGSGDWDFIYLDTWYALDYEFLPHINWMINMAKARLHPTGKVLAWGYDEMIHHYVRDCLRITQMASNVKTMAVENLKALKLRFPLSGKFVEWFRKNLHADRQTVIQKASVLAAEIQKFELPLEAVDSINATKQAFEGFERWADRINAAVRV